VTNKKTSAGTTAEIEAILSNFGESSPAFFHLLLTMSKRIDELEDAAAKAEAEAKQEEYDRRWRGCEP